MGEKKTATDLDQSAGAESPPACTARPGKSETEVRNQDLMSSERDKFEGQQPSGPHEDMQPAPKDMTSHDHTAGAEPFQVRTKRPVEDETNLPNEDATPRMPHERDESDDSQASGPRDDIQQAFDDVTSGQVDTDCRNQPGVEETVEQGADRQGGTCVKGEETRSKHDRKP